MSNIYFVEITDTFGGEANYSWVTRHRIKAKTQLGAIQKLSRHSGMSWRKEYDSGAMSRYNSKSGATCAFIQEYDTDYHSEYRFSTDDVEA